MERITKYVFDLRATTRNDIGLDQQGFELSCCCLFASNAYEPYEIDELLREFCRDREAAGGILWLNNGDSIDDAQALVWNSDGILCRPVKLHIAALEIRIEEGAQIRVEKGATVTVHADQAIGISFGGDETQPIDDIAIALDPDDRSGVISFDVETGPIAPVIKYFHGQPVQSFTYPLWQDGGGRPQRLQVRADPRRPFDATRTVFLPVGQVAPFATTLRTTNGTAIALTPGPGGGYSLGYDPVSGDPSSYSTVVGPWQASAVGATGTTGQSLPMVCGLSGLEFAELEDGLVQFAPGPAYSASFGATGKNTGPLLQSDAPGGLHPVNTAYGYPAGARYFAQPDHAALFTTGLTGAFLAPFEVPVGLLPAGETAGSFPLAPYGAAVGGIDALSDFEASILSPARRAIVNEVANFSSIRDGPTSAALLGQAAGDATGATGVGPTGPGPTGPAGPTGPFVYAASPQGLLSTFVPGSHDWESLTLATTAGGTRQLRLTEIGGALRSALLTNNMFLVVSDADRLLAAASVLYKLTAESFVRLAQQGVPADVIDYARYLTDLSYESLAYFQPVIEDALGPTYYAQYGRTFIDCAQFFEIAIDGWTFQFAPSLWSQFGTLLILKFSELSLETLANDTALWTQPDSFNADVAKTQAQLLKIIEDAKQQQATQKVFDYFVDTVVGSRNDAGGSQSWNGALFLNAVVPLDELPPQLEGLAAGIDPAKFFAHHVGITVTPFEYSGGPVIELNDSALFGLIFYEAPGDLAYANEPYAFKVLTLSVLFANSRISSFDSQIELLVAELFGELATLLDSEHGNNLILRGTYQNHGGEKSYVFLQESRNRFTLTSQVLCLVEIDKVTFNTILRDEAAGDVHSRFAFWGSMQFLELAGFDLFSFGPGYADGEPTANGRIAFSNLTVEMSFDPTQSAIKPSFAFNASEVALDLSQSSARPTSLYSRFPLTLTALVQGQEKTSPASLGFITVQTPLDGQQLSYPWFGLQFSLNLGSPGGLAAKTGFAATVIAAWAPGGTEPQIFTGLQLPGSTGGKRQISIEGPLSLNIGPIEFEVNDGEYLLRLRNIALGLLGLQFPPDAQTEIVLFGDPRSRASNTLGWYAAYLKNQGETGGAGTSPPLVIEAEE